MWNQWCEILLIVPRYLSRITLHVIQMPHVLCQWFIAGCVPSPSISKRTSEQSKFKWNCHYLPNQMSAKIISNIKLPRILLQSRNTASRNGAKRHLISIFKICFESCIHKLESSSSAPTHPPSVMSSRQSERVERGKTWGEAPPPTPTPPTPESFRRSFFPSSKYHAAYRVGFRSLHRKFSC